MIRGLLAVSLAAGLCGAAPQEPTQAAGGIKVTSARIVRTPPPGVLFPRIPVETESEFLTTDPAVFYLLLYTGGSKDDKIAIEWHNPSGAVVQQNFYTQTAEGAPIHLVWRLLIAGGPAADAPGDWRVRLLCNDRSVAVSTFKISAPPESAVSIATRTVLPQGTVGVPYFLQLSARGGKPPYRWTSARPLPDGLSLSESGTVGGTPNRRGTYRAAIEAKDSAGDSVSRTFGIGVGAAAAKGVEATRRLSKSAGPNACAQTGSQAEFSVDDAKVVLAAALKAPRGREGRVEWLNPRGEVSQVEHVSTANERQECMVKALPIAGRKASQEPGEWRVRLFWAEAEVFTLKFTIAPLKAGAVPATGNPVAAARSGRVAVLIANQHYEKSPPATALAADMDALAKALRDDGFEVVRVADANLEGLRQMEGTLDGKLQAGDTVLVYYTGYDARLGGDDWLLPVSFDPADTRPMQTRAYSAVRLLQWLEDSKAALKLVFLDSAPAPGQPAENPGAVLGEVDESTALVYSRSPSPGAFAGALAQVVGKPGIDARTALGSELPKAASRTTGSAPVAILGGGGDFVFRQAGSPR